MKRAFAALLILALIAGLGGCKMPVSKPGPAEPTGADPTATQTAPTEPTGDKIKGVNVIDAFNKTEQITVDWGDVYPCEFRIPAIDLDTANAAAFNQEIYDSLYPYYEMTLNPEDDLLYSVYYSYSVYKGYVAILTGATYFVPASEFMGTLYETYYYDVAKDRIMESEEEYLRAMGYTLPQLKAAAEKTREYRELAEAGIYDGGMTYEWDDVELTGCILNYDQVLMIFHCTWSAEWDGTAYDYAKTVVIGTDAQEFYALV